MAVYSPIRSRAERCQQHDLSHLNSVRPRHRNGVVHERVRSRSSSPRASAQFFFPRLLGNPKEKESLTGLLLNTRVIQVELFSLQRRKEGR